MKTLITLGGAVILAASGAAMAADPIVDHGDQGTTLDNYLVENGFQTAEPSSPTIVVTESGMMRGMDADESYLVENRFIEDETQYKEESGPSEFADVWVPTSDPESEAPIG